MTKRGPIIEGLETPAQITNVRLETQVKEVSDNRAFGSRTARTCQAEAIAPDLLAQVVRDAIENRIDLKALRRVLGREKRVRRELTKKLEAAKLVGERFARKYAFAPVPSGHRLRAGSTTQCRAERSTMYAPAA